MNTLREGIVPVESKKGKLPSTEFEITNIAGMIIFFRVYAVKGTYIRSLPMILENPRVGATFIVTNEKPK